MSSVAEGVRRLASTALRRGAHGAPITTGPDRTVLLFFEDVERDCFVRNDRHLRRGARRVFHALTEGQRVSGFEVAFRLLCLALERAGCRVVINNYELARRHPEHPVGICGYPHILDRWELSNPAVLGPGLFDHPMQAPTLMDDPRFRSYLVPCEWMYDLFSVQYHGRCRIWFGGLDLERWPDAAGRPKDIDILVYDKIRWNREEVESTLAHPVLDAIRAKGLTTHLLVRGAYGRSQYRELLARSRAMLFLCESETQGLAYQEAMACNVPILAWDPKQWMDPQRVRWTSEVVPATSVPFFSPACGERFLDAAAFPAALERLWARLADYTPRAFVADALSLRRSAALYLEAYTAAAR